MHTNRSNAVRVGVIGCGYWGPNLIRNFSRTADSQVIAVSDLQIERARRAAREFNVASVYESPSDLIADSNVDLVIVATPSTTHHALAKAALLAGKHVLVMKPVATKVEEAEELVSLAEANGLLMAVDHTFVYTGPVRRIREMVDTGELGDLYYLDSVRINLGLFQGDVNVLWDLAPHDISIIDYVLGGTLPTEVSAVAASHAGSAQENIAYLTLRYGPQTLAHVHVNWLAPAKVRRTIVGGSRRMIVYDDMEPSEKIRIYDKGVTISTSSSADEVYSQLVSYRSGDMHAPRLDMREALATEAEHIVKCIKTGDRPIADGHAGLRNVRILKAAEQSIAEGSRLVSLESESVRGPLDRKREAVKA